MLGALQMTTEEALRTCSSLAGVILSKDKVQDGAFKATILGHKVRELVAERTFREFMLDALKDSNMAKTFICAMLAKDLAHPRRFQTYHVRTLASANCRIWEARRATTSATHENIASKCLQLISRPKCLRENICNLQTLENHSGWIRPVAFSPDGKQAASVSDDLKTSLPHLTKAPPRLEHLTPQTLSQLPDDGPSPLQSYLLQHADEDPIHPSLKKQNALMNMCDSACWLLSKGKVDMGYGCVGQFKDALGEVEVPYPSLITLPYQILDEFSSIPDFILPGSLLRYISKLFASRFGQEHPMSVNCRHLLNFPNRHELLLSAMKQICEILPKTFGQTNPHTLDAQSVYNWMLISFQHYQEAETRAQHLLADCETSLDMKHETMLEFRNQFAYVLFKQGNFAAAEKMACLNLQIAGFSCSRSQREQLKDVFLLNLRNLFLALFHQGKVKLAESVVRAALRLSIHFHEELHFTREIAFANLKEILESQGRTDEAERVLQMDTHTLRTSYLAENDWDEERAGKWALAEGEDVSKYYPFPHTMYCSCASEAQGFDAPERERFGVVRQIEKISIP
jgi:hypothetical protein